MNTRHDKSETIHFEEIASRWLESKIPQLKESSIARYRFLLHRYIFPTFALKPIEDITMAALDDFTAELMKRGNASGEGLSPKTTADTIQVIRNILGYASRIGICSENPSLRLIRIRQEPRPLIVLSINDQQKLWNHLSSRPSEKNLGILFGMCLGLRIGEVCALRWEDISLEESIITIERTVQRIPKISDITNQHNPDMHKRSDNNKTQIIATRPKSSKSARVIPIPDQLYNLLLRVDSRDGFVLSGTDRIVEPRSLSYHYRKVLNSCGIKYYSFHMLRHTFATRCVELGFDIKTLSEILGHSTVSITLNRYVHPSIEQKRKNMALLSGMFD